MAENKRQLDGSCVISEEVIASIAASAAAEVAGVAALTPRPNLRSLMPGDAASKCIGVVNADNAVTLDVYLQLEYGAHIPTVAGQVQKAVKSAVQSMTGKPVTRVNVHIQDVEVAPASQESAEADE